MRRKIVECIIIIICFLLQSTVFQALSIASISPNLLVVVVASFGFMRGRKEGMWIGFVSGALLDIFFGPIFGFYALSYLVVGYVNGMLHKIFYPDDIKLPMLSIMCSDLALNFIVYLFLFLARKKTDLAYYAWHLMVPEMVYTLLVTLVLYFLILRVNRWLESIEKRSAAKFV